MIHGSFPLYSFLGFLLLEPAHKEGEVQEEGGTIYLVLSRDFLPSPILEFCPVYMRNWRLARTAEGAG